MERYGDPYKILATYPKKNTILPQIRVVYSESFKKFYSFLITCKSMLIHQILFAYCNQSYRLTCKMNGIDTPCTFEKQNDVRHAWKILSYLYTKKQL